MLAKDPDQRPAMADVATELLACARDLADAHLRAIANLQWDEVRVRGVSPPRAASPAAFGAPPAGAAVPMPAPLAAPARVPLAAPTPAPPAAPVRLDENVQFTVRRPRMVAPGRWYKLLAFAHLSEKRADAPADEPDPIAEVERQAGQMLDGAAADYPSTTTDSDRPIPEEGALTFVPVVAGIDFNPRSISFRWVKPVHGFAFDFRAPAELNGRVLRGQLLVFLGSIIVAEVSVSVSVDATRASVVKGQDRSNGRPYRRIFASYSHKDRAIVEEFQDYARAMGDRYIVDCLDLRSGENWSQAIAQLIESADVFQLFWSWNALRSPYVRQEWEHALSLGGRNVIRPTYWEDPLPEDAGLPPPALRELHFQRIAFPARRAAAPQALPGLRADDDVVAGDRYIPAPLPQPVPVPVAAAASGGLSTTLSGASGATAPGIGSAPTTMASMPATGFDDELMTDMVSARRSRRRAVGVSLGALAACAAVLFAVVSGGLLGGAVKPVDVTAPAPPVATGDPPLVPETTVIDIRGLPAGTAVSLDGAPSEPLIRIPRSETRHTITVRPPAGYGKARTIEVDGARDQTIDLEDLAAPAAHPAAPRRHRR